MANDDGRDDQWRPVTTNETFEGRRWPATATTTTTDDGGWNGKTVSKTSLAFPKGVTWYLAKRNTKHHVKRTSKSKTRFHFWAASTSPLSYSLPSGPIPSKRKSTRHVFRKLNCRLENDARPWFRQNRLDFKITVTNWVQTVKSLWTTRFLNSKLERKNQHLSPISFRVLNSKMTWEKSTLKVWSHSEKLNDVL